MKVKLFFDKEIIKDNHVDILIPKFGFDNMNKNHPQYGRFKRFRDEGSKYIEYVEKPEDSNYFVYPVKWAKNDDKLKSFLKKADKFNKKTLIFFNDDSDENMFLENENVAIFRTSFYNSKKNKNEYSIPGWSPDIGLKYLRDKKDLPVIGFCGCFNNNIHRFVSLITLSQSKKVICKFNLNYNFWGGWSGSTEKSELDHAKKVRSMFNENIIETDYTVCCRGAGNFSYRLYETLSAGRIPIIINTDIVLPHDEIIDWKKFSVWVEVSDIDKIDDIVRDFHNNITKEEFLKIQKKCREVYENFIRPYEFFKVWFEKDMRG